MPSLSCILPGALYLGNLESAIEPKLIAQHKITHIVSILQNWPSQGPHHLSIDLDDAEMENLLEHLPRVCDFIDQALASGGVVLVHCFGGISRSASCVIAYTMRKNTWKLVQAIDFVRERRPIITPNDGFLYQLQVFERCGYAVAEDHPTYMTWKTAYDNSMAKWGLSLVHIIPVVENQIYSSSEFPDSKEDVKLILGEHAITHILSLGVAPIDMQSEGFSLLWVYVPPFIEEDKLLVSLPECVDFTHTAIESGGRVLVHSHVISEASIVICAYLMSIRRMSATEAASVLSESIPFFKLSTDAKIHLDLYEACDFRPTSEHPIVWEWAKDTYRVSNVALIRATKRPSALDTPMS